MPSRLGAVLSGAHLYDCLGRFSRGVVCASERGDEDLEFGPGSSGVGL